MIGPDGTQVTSELDVVLNSVRFDFTLLVGSVVAQEPFDFSYSEPVLPGCCYATLFD